jgi:hypothetical protein
MLRRITQWRLVRRWPMPDYGTLYKIAEVLVLASFLPFTALSYLGFRKDIRENEIKNAIKRLGGNPERYQGLYTSEIDTKHFMVAVGLHPIWWTGS